MVNIEISGETKKWYNSKTLWVGVIAFILGVLETIQGDLSAGLPVTVLSVLMISLRIITSGKIKFFDN